MSCIFTIGFELVVKLPTRRTLFEFQFCPCKTKYITAMLDCVMPFLFAIRPVLSLDPIKSFSFLFHYGLTRNQLRNSLFVPR
jgi:hypothetical protein